MILTIILGLITVAFFLAYRYVTKTRGTLEQLGIPVIKPGFFLGSPPYGLHKVNFLEHIPDNFKRLNTLTYGHYDGRNPVIVTMDTVCNAGEKYCAKSIIHLSSIRKFSKVFWSKTLMHSPIFLISKCQINIRL